MKLSQLVTKTSKTIPANETAKNAQLLIRAGYVHKELAGVYAYLPLGFRLLDNSRLFFRRLIHAQLDLKKMNTYPSLRILDL